MRKVAVPQILLLMLVAGVLLTGCDTLQARMELNKGNSTTRTRSSRTR